MFEVKGMPYPSGTVCFSVRILDVEHDANNRILDSEKGIEPMKLGHPLTRCSPRRKEHGFPRRPAMAAGSAIALAALFAGPALAGQDRALLEPGSYEVTFRLELPYLESWAINRSATICIPTDASNGALPVLSGNNPLSECPAVNVRREGAALSFGIRCEGRDAARARALYTLTPDGFAGRIAMVMGGKNMTMTEVQVGRWLGPCKSSGTSQN
jgi:uncharacterized protein DUF3617